MSVYVFLRVYSSVYSDLRVFIPKKRTAPPQRRKERRCCKGCKGCKAGKFVLGQIMPSHHHISFQPRFELKAHVVIVNSYFLDQFPYKAFIIFCNSGRMCLEECFKFIKLLKRTCVRCILKKEFMLIFPDCIYLVKKLIDATSS